MWIRHEVSANFSQYCNTSHFAPFISLYQVVVAALEAVAAVLQKKWRKRRRKKKRKLTLAVVWICSEAAAATEATTRLENNRVLHSRVSIFFVIEYACSRY